MRIFAILGSIILAVSSDASAQVSDLSTGGTIPNAVDCMGRHYVTGGFVEVRQRTGSSMHWAHAAWDADGWPAITYSSAYFQLPETMQKFTSAHECGHLSMPTTNEFLANCYALSELPLSRIERDFVGTYHRHLGPLPAQYGGSGSEFWARTVATCSELF